MTITLLAIAIPLVAAVVFMLGVFIGRDRGYQAGFHDGFGAGWEQRKFDAEMDATNPDDGYAELYGDGEVTS